MDGYGKETYGNTWAEAYDEFYIGKLATEEAVTLLAELADPSLPVLDLGAGTGRLAIPLADRGFSVHAIENSDRMVDQMKRKNGSDKLEIVTGGFTNVNPPSSQYGLIFIAYRTFTMLLIQEEQVACFERASKLLAANGCFVIETFVPEPHRYGAHGQSSEVRDLKADHVTVLFAIHDALAQRLDGQNAVFGPDGVRLYPAVVRYVWPSELDLMARIAGFMLAARYESWAKKPFTASSRDHVSVFRKKSLRGFAKYSECHVSGVMGKRPATARARAPYGIGSRARALR